MPEPTDICRCGHTFRQHSTTTGLCTQGCLYSHDDPDKVCIGFQNNHGNVTPKPDAK